MPRQALAGPACASEHPDTRRSWGGQQLGVLVLHEPRRYADGRGLAGVSSCAAPTQDAGCSRTASPCCGRASSGSGRRRSLINRALTWSCHTGSGDITEGRSDFGKDASESSATCQSLTGLFRGHLANQVCPPRHPCRRESLWGSCVQPCAEAGGGEGCKAERGHGKRRP